VTEPRLTRKERQERTRSHLLRAAGTVFARRGFAHASIDQVAAEAGYTKGAFYANFASKEELFLALLEERFEDRVAALDEVLARDAAPEAAAREGADDFTRYLRRDAEWERLFFEFAAHAARAPEFRGELVARYDALIARIARVIEGYTRRVGFRPPGPVEEFALMIFTVSNGVALQRMLDPDGVRDDLLADMLELLTLGAIAKAGG
jgi:AcrR family transcriptional regulator